MQLPNTDKSNLNLMQSYIVFQIYVSSLKSFTIEIAISDTSNIKRRLLFSACSKEIINNSLHCRIPFVNFPINIWVNLCIDILSFVSEFFKGQSFRAIDFICLSGNCKVRKIYGMRNSLTDLIDEGLNGGDYSLIPKGIVFPKGIEYTNLTLNNDMMKNLERKEKIATPNLNTRHNNNNPNTNAGFITGKKGLLKDDIMIQGQTGNKVRAKSQAKPLKMTQTKVSPFNLKNEVDNDQEGFDGLNDNQNFKGKKTVANGKWDMYDQNGRKKKNINGYFGTAGGDLFIPCINGIEMGDTISKNKKKQINEQLQFIPKRNMTSINPMIKKQQPDFVDTIPPLSNKLFGTFNPRTIECNHWDNNSIQEMVDFDTHNNTFLTKNDEIIYHDKPIQDNKILPSQIIMNDNKENALSQEKQKMMDQILKDEVTSFTKESIRPYTPPLGKLGPVEADDPVNLTKINESIIQNHYSDMIYDQSKGCYFNVKTKVYYDVNFKNVC